MNWVLTPIWALQSLHASTMPSIMLTSEIQMEESVAVAKW